MVSRPSGSIALFFARPIVRLMASRGMDVDAFLQDFGLSRDEVMHGDSRISIEVGVRMFDRLIEVLDDPILGISLARHADYASFGALGLAAAAGGRLRDVLSLGARYSDLVTDALGVRLVEGDELISVEVEGRGGLPAHPQALLLTIAVVRGLVRTRVRGAKPLRVVVGYPLSEAGRAAAARFFECPVELGDVYRIDYPADSAEAMLSGSDVVVAAAVEKALTSRMPPRGRTTVDELVGYVETHLGSGEPSLEDAAAALGTTPRSLQRKLKSEGSSWQRVVDDIRRRLAAEYVRDSRLSFTEVSYRLGFADLSSFSRSFRKWYGKSASDFRNDAPTGRPPRE